MTGRDFDQNPYTPDEQRVAKYWGDTVGIGGGDDPIGALIASHRFMAEERARISRRTLDVVYCDSRKTEHTNIEMEGDARSTPPSTSA